jgi:hypothetical protein
MGLWQRLLVAGLGGSLVGVMCFLPQGAIAQSCVAETSCSQQPIRVIPGQWVNFQIINRTGGIINIEQPSSLEAIALSPGQIITLGGTTTHNASFLFWNVQGLSVEARVRQLSQNNLQVEFLWGDGYGNDSLYLKDDGSIELL